MSALSAVQRLARWGWVLFPPDAALRAWVEHARPAAERAVADPTLRAQWLHCEGTWFVGVNALPNGPDGSVAGSGPLGGAPMQVVTDQMGLAGVELDRAQVSVCYPGYPRPRRGESDAAFRYRRDRDAAHVDGLHPVGATRARMLRERHAFLLGLPLNHTDAGAAPFVLWEGSHHIVRRHLEPLLRGIEGPGEDVDLTRAYHAARREIFESCPRRVIHGEPGQAWLVHRLALHGIAPWQNGARADGGCRMVAYFRPEAGFAAARWIGCEDWERDAGSVP